jgi:hypothetical protein
MIDANKLQIAIQSTPLVYPPELSFLGNIPVMDVGIVRAMLSSPVYVSPRAPMFAFSMKKDGRSFLTLLLTSDSLAGGLDQEGLDLLHELYRPPRKVGWLERITTQRKADKQQRERIGQMRRDGRLNKRLARAISCLYFPVFHDDDIIVAFPEDDFTDNTGRSDSRSFERALKSSRIQKICKKIQPLRCGLPKTFCNQLLATFRR